MRITTILPVQLKVNLKQLRAWCLAALCVGLFLSPSLQAKDMKIAVLDYGAAMLKSDRAQKMADVIKKDLKKREDDIRALEQEIKSMTEKAERDGPVMSDSDKYELTKKFETSRTNIVMSWINSKRDKKRGVTILCGPCALSLERLSRVL